MRKFQQFRSNLRSLESAYEQDITNPFILAGIAEQFAVQFELGWKALRKLALRDGALEWNTGSPRSVIKEAFAMYPFIDGDLWLDMLTDRNRVLHVYDQSAVSDIVSRVLDQYIPEFQKMEREVQLLLEDSDA